MSTLFYRNTRLLSLMVFLVMAAGMAAFVNLPRLEDPVLTSRIAVVLTPFPGASAQRVEALVSERLETRLREIPEIDVLTSISRPGLSAVTVELQESITIVEPIWSEIRDKLGDAANELPAGALGPTLDNERGYAFTLLAALVWEGENKANPAILNRFSEELQNRLRNVGGTDLVRRYGEPEEEIQVLVNEDALASVGLTISQVAAAVAAADAKVAAGSVRSTRRELSVEVSGEVESLERLGRIPLRESHDGWVLRLQDVARLQRGVVEPPATLARVGTASAVVVAARMSPDQRVDRWAAAARDVLAEFAERLPAGVRLEVIFDQSTYTEARLATLMGNLLTGAGIVVAVLFLTLGIRAALVVTLALPLTALLALAGLQLMGISIQQMAVTGLIVALGLMVDNAIVMTDAIRARLGMGLSREAAVADALQRFWVPLLSSTLTTILAFMPVILLPGAAGEFVSSIGLSVVAALVSSYVLAITVVPALAGHFLASGSVTRWSRELSIPPLTRLFAASLNLSLRNPRLSVLATLCVPLLGFIGATTLTEQFFPPADRDQFHIQVTLPPSATIHATTELTATLRERLLESPEIEAVNVFIGESAPAFYYNLQSDKDGLANYAQLQVQVASLQAVAILVPRLQRELDAAFPSAQILVRELNQGPPFAAPLEVRLVGPELATLRRLGNEVRSLMAAVTAVTHTQTSLDSGEPKLLLQVDEDAARLAGLSLTEVATQLDASFSGRVGGSLTEATEDLPIRVRLDGASRGRVATLAALALLGDANPGAGFPGMPVDAVAELELIPTEAAIPRRNGERVNTVSGFLRYGVLPQSALDDFQTRLDSADLTLPSGYRLEYGGESAERNDAVGNLLGSVGLIVILMIATVVLAFNSYRYAAIVFVVAIQAMGLGLLAVTLGGYPLGFVVIIGVMGLVGLAINAAIIILSGLQENPQARAGDIDAIRGVVLASSRHIVSTTITTMGGFIPLILAEGGFWPPFAVAIAGGTGLATLVSFYFVPAVFCWTMTRRTGAAKPAATPMVEAIG